MNRSKKKIQLAVVIPTFNRSENLRECIRHFDKQIVPDYVDLSLVISNTASTDDTPQMLDQLLKSRSDLYLTNSMLDWEDGNYGGMLSALPTKIDWIWLMGDDDQFVSPNSVSKISRIISKNATNDNFAFIHACDSKRSKNTGKITHDTTFNMCKKFGYLEMLGWFTSLVVRKTEFVQAVSGCEKARQSHQQHKLIDKPYSAFFHSGYFFQYLHKKDAAFLDEPIVCEQSASDKNKTAERWRDANTGERYLFIADDFQRLKSENIDLVNLPSQFFKYHKYHLWDRLMSFQIDATMELAALNENTAIQSYLKRFLQNWSRVEFIATMLLKTETQKWLIITSRLIKANCLALLDKPHDENIAKSLKETRELLTLSCYDYHVNFSDVEIFRK